MALSDVSSELVEAERDVAALRVKLEAARHTDLPPEEGHALVRRLRIDLKAAEDRCAAASQAHITAARTQLEDEARAAREASARARDEARRQVVDAARAIVREMLPHVEQ